MPYDELLGWFAYLERRPVDWRDDLRASYLLQAQGVKEKPSKLFPSLEAITKKVDDSPAASFKGSFVHHKLLSAVGGDKLEFL